jgi:uncharacterized lipoprotein NlpE involved in copper resistance
MNLTQQVTTLATAGLLALVAGFAATPAALQAAPASQEAPALSGVYGTTVLPAADASGRLETLTLADDGSAIFTSDFAGEAAVLVETGTWLADAEGAVVLTLTAQTGEAYEEPVEILLTVGEDGALTAGDEAMFGSEGLTLLPSEGGFGLVLASGEIPAASSPGRVITAGLLPDNTLEMYTDFLNGEAPIRETGVWSLDAAGQFTFELTANDAGEYATPQTIGWAWAEGARLVAVAYDQALYGEAGLTLTVQSSFVEYPIPGTYVTPVLPGASSPGYISLVTLFENGNGLILTTYLNGEPAVEEFATWAATPGETVTVTATGNLEREYDEPVVAVFNRVGDALEADGILLGKLTQLTPADMEALTGAGAAPPAAAPEASLSWASDELPSASTPGRVITLNLGESGGVMMSTDYLNDEPIIAETGSWTDNGDDTLTVTLSGRDDGTRYDAPVVITFALQDDGGLVAVEYDETLFGSEGLALQPVE